MTDKEDKKRKLKAIMARVLRKNNPVLEEDIYQDLVTKFASNLQTMIEKYITDSKYNESGAEKNYSDLEKRLLVEFLEAVPEASGGKKDARDFVNAILNDVINKSGLELSDSSRRRLLDEVDRSFTTFAGFVKAGNEEEAEERYSAFETRVANALKLGLLRAKETESERQLKEHISRNLDLTGLTLENYEKIRVQDQILRVFSDYVLAPEEERERVYSLGEERIIFSLLDPASRKQNKPKVKITGNTQP